jgi:hypothetical protein
MNPNSRTVGSTYGCWWISLWTNGTRSTSCLAVSYQVLTNPRMSILFSFRGSNTSQRARRGALKSGMLVPQNGSLTEVTPTSSTKRPMVQGCVTVIGALVTRGTLGVVFGALSPDVDLLTSPTRTTQRSSGQMTGCPLGLTTLTSTFRHSLTRPQKPESNSTTKSFASSLSLRTWTPTSKTDVTLGSQSQVCSLGSLNVVVSACLACSHPISCT